MFNFYKRESRWLRGIPVAIAMSLVSSIWSHAATFYSKAASTDFTAVGSWGANTDGTGAAPASISNADDFIIQNGSVMNLNTGSAAVRTLVINAGSLTVGSNTLTVSLATTNISLLTVNTGGTLTVTGGTININGQLNILNTAIFNQSGGTISVDGNDNGVALNSVTGVIINITSSALTCTGGVLRIVDPHVTTTRCFGYNNGTTVNASGTHVFEVGDGVSTQTGGTNGFRVDPWSGSGKFNFNDLRINTAAGTNRFLSQQFGGFVILQDLLVNLGEARFNSTYAVRRNITVAATGTLTTLSTLTFGGDGVASNLAQVVSGTGVFRNLAASPTANFSGVTINNTNASGVTFSGANSLLSGANTGTASATLTFTSGLLNTGGGIFISGVSAGGVGGGISWTSGGFTTGSIYRRWLGTTSLTVGATPTAVAFPFANGTSSRRVLMNRSAGWTTGGWIQATYTHAAGLTPSVFADGAYNVDVRTNAGWTFTSGGTINLGVTTLAVGLQGEGLVVTSTVGTPPRFIQAAGAVGTHAAGTGTTAAPFANRSGLNLALLNNGGNPHHIGINNADLGLYSIASGAWENAGTWSTGVPGPASNPLISPGNTVTVNAALAEALNVTVAGTLVVSGNTLNVGGASGTGVTVNNGGALTVSGGTLNVGPQDNSFCNRTVSLLAGSAFTVSSGTVNLAGNLTASSGMTYTQSGGNINVDGNANGVGGNSTASTLMNLNAASLTSVNMTGGTLTFIDPPTTTANTLTLSGGTNGNMNVTSGHTIRFGDGVSSTAGGTNGWRVDTWFNTSGMQFGNLEVNGPAGTNRFLTGAYQQPVIQDVTVNSGGECRIASLFLGRNLLVNGGGTLTSTTTLGFVAAGFLNGGSLVFAASPNAQTIGGAGTFRNLTAAPTGNLTALTVNNSNGTGVTMNIPLVMTGALNMTAGRLNTTLTNILTIESALSNTFPGGSNGFVTGPMRSRIPASFTNYAAVFPVGKTAANWLIFFNATTNAGGPVTIQVETNNTLGAPTAFDASLLAVNANREWVTSIVSGVEANLTSYSVQAYDGAIVTGNALSAIKTPATQFSIYGNGSDFNAGTAPLGPFLVTSVPPLAGSTFPERIGFGTTGPLNVSSVTMEQSTVPSITGGVSRSSTNNNLARVIISAVGSSGTIALEDLTFTYTGTAPSGDITAVTLWNGTFGAPGTQIASTTISGGQIEFTGLAAPIVGGNNYFWLRFNVSGSAGLGNTVDVTILSGDASNWTLSGTTATPPLPLLTLNPTGNRIIDYCAPTYSTGCGTGADAITNVSLGTLTNASGCTGTPFYTFYNAATVPNLDQGATVSISITYGTDGSQASGVWIDFDQSGTFDVSEFFSTGLVTGGSSTSTFNIIVPPGATLGQTRMRIRGGDDVAVTSGVPCGASGSGFGETEDYRVNISSPTPKSLTAITATQQTGGMARSTTNNNLLRVELDAAGSAGTLTLSQIRFTLTGTSLADLAASGISLWTGTSTAPSAQIGTSQNPTATVNFTGLTTTLNSGFTYLWLRVNTSAVGVIGNLVDATIAVNDITISATGGAIAPGLQPTVLVDPAGERFIDYCAPTYSSGPGTTDQMTNVTLAGFSATLNNTSGASTTPFYTFFNAVTVPDLLQGVTYPISITFGSDGTQWSAVWLDFNQNGLFDASEFFGPSSAAAGLGTSTFNIIVPPGATLGNTRMRVRGGNDSQMNSGNPCGAATSSFGETEDYIVTIIPPPNCTTLLPFPASATTASAATVCNGGNVTFGLTVGMPNGSGITYQLQRNGVDQGAAQSSVPFSAVVTAGGNWGIVVKCNGTTQVTATTVALTVISPVVTPGAAVSRCGFGTLSPSASSATGGATLRWYTTATLGTEVGSGPSPNVYITPSLPAPSTTTYYVESTVNLGSAASGPASPAIGAFAAGIAPGAGIFQTFNTASAVTIQSIDLYPIAAGDMIVELRNSSNVTVATATRSITAGEANSTGTSIGTPLTMTLNFNVPAGTGWRMVFLSGPNCIRNSAGAAPSYGVATEGLTHTGNWFADNNYWYFGFNWQLEGRCASSRSSVLATVTTPPVLVASPSVTICDGQSTTITAFGPTYSTFTWTGPLSGASQVVSPSATTTYVLNASGGGCNNIASTTVTVLPTPTNPVIIAAPLGGRCLGQNKTLTTSSTTSGVVELLNQNFNSGTLASLGWSQTTSGISVPFSIVTAPYTYDVTTITNFSITTPNSSFVIINSDADAASLGTTSLESPAFSTLGRSNVDLTFTHVYRQASSTGSVEYSANGGPWLATGFSMTATTPAQTWVGSAIQTTTTTIPLPAGAVNQANVRVRFTYDYDWSWFWMIDNVIVTTNDVVSYRWSEPSGFGGIPAPQQLFSPTNTSAIVTPTQGGSYTYTVNVTNTVGCNALIPGTHTFNVSDVVVGVSSTGPQRVGTNLAITATPTGGFGGYSYQWFKLPAITPPGDVIGGTNALAYPGAVEANSGTYRAVVTDGNGCTTQSDVDALVYAALVWNGSQSNSWTDPLNWSPNIVPANGTDCTTPLTRDNVVITATGTPPLYPGAGVFVDNFGVESGLLTINNNVRVCGSLAGGNGIVGKVVGAGSIELVGSGTNLIGGNLEVDDIVINKTGVGPVQVQGNLRINNLMTVTAAPGGIVVNTSGNVILTSSATQSGKIGPIPGGVSITATAPGKFTQERYIPVPASGRWYLLGSPIVNKNFTDYADDFRVVGLSTGFGTQGGGILPSIEPERSTILKYDPLVVGNYLDTAQKMGWRIPANTDNITNGQGFRVFINPYEFAANLNRLDNQGLIHFGNKTFPTLRRVTPALCQSGVTASTNVACQEKDFGWNLLSNPYPSPIDWDDADWTKPVGMNNAFFTYNNAGLGGYQAYLGGGGDAMGNTVNGGANANIIASSQGFFVKAFADNLTLSATEGVKSTTNGSFYRTAVATDRVKVRMTRNGSSDLQFDGMIRFDSESTFGMDANKDLDAFTGPGAEFSFIGDNGEALWLNTVPVPTETKVIPMNTVYGNVSATYTFSFIDGASISNGVEVFLKDNYLGTMTSMNAAGASYTFAVNVNDASSSIDRFEVVISPDAVTGVSKLINGNGFRVYPNPSSSTSKVTLAVSGAKGSKASVEIVDVVGKVVYTETMSISQESNVSEKSVDLGLASGVYTVKVTTSGKTFTEKLIVR